MSLPRLLIWLTVMFACTGMYAQEIFEVHKSVVSINSDAPNELIRATSKNMKGLVNPGKNNLFSKLRWHRSKGSTVRCSASILMRTTWSRHGILK